MEKKKVLLATPSWGTAPPKACQYRQAMCYHLGKLSADPNFPYDFGIIILPELLVQYSREEMCSQAVEQGFDYIFMIDDDMIGPIDLVEKLLQADVDIVAPLAFTRRLPHNPVVYGQRGGWMLDSPHHIIETHVVRNYPKDALFQCDAVGFGAVLIKTDVLKKMQKPWFFTMWGTKGTGEDIWFCIKAAREVGAKTFCDSRLKLGHLGPEEYVGEADYEKANPEIATLREVAGEWTREKAKANLIA